MPVDSKVVDPLLARAKLSHSGSTSGITELKKERKVLHKMIAAKEDRSKDRCERNSPTDTQISAEGGAGGAPGAGAEIPLQLPGQPIVRQLCPCSPWRAMGEKIFT
ncbi:hypothetical protein HGM15179_006522 [Zosterops borbonicus]|uniref:Uncharacterized protein n=1 Tax=Zosterops borbonicus TaxID=364589 RepID=A0A8K1LN99_9PASS|nr:hypothetical protein HGM15179_006522 [Zosterops borbonicus]